MAVKDKLVTLEDLKVAYDSLIDKMGGVGEVWQDITDELTWVSDTSLGYAYAYPGGTIEIGSAGYSRPIDNRKRATITLAKGDRLRITGSFWAEADYQLFAGCKTTALIYKVDAQNIAGGIMSGGRMPADQLGYGEIIFHCPAAGSYYIWDYAGDGSVIVEKQVTT